MLCLAFLLLLAAMIDLTYILLLFCLAATNLSRIIQGFRWVYEYLSTPRTPRLVPYFNRRGPCLVFDFRPYLFR
jgi:hypothetical protein